MLDDGLFDPRGFLGPVVIVGLAVRAVLHVRRLRRQGVHVKQYRSAGWYHFTYLVVMAIALLFGSVHIAVAVALSALITTEGAWIGRMGMYTKTLGLLSELKAHYMLWERHLAPEEAAWWRGPWLKAVWRRLRPPPRHREWHERRDELVIQVSAQFALQTLVAHLALEGLSWLPRVANLLSSSGSEASLYPLHDLFFAVFEAFLRALTLVVLAVVEFFLMSMALGPIMASGMHLEPRLFGQSGWDQEPALRSSGGPRGDA